MYNSTPIYKSKNIRHRVITPLPQRRADICIGEAPWTYKGRSVMAVRYAGSIICV
jgi:hypothetical protein